MNPLGFLITLLSSMVVLLGSRRFAMLGVFVGICYITQGQMITVAGFHFYAIRIILLVGFFRILLRGELQGISFAKIDVILLLYVVYGSMVEALRLGVWQEQVGGAYNMLLSYFVFRALVTNSEDLQQLLSALAILIVPLAISMLWESYSGHNFFNILGGQLQAKLRGERFRCIGGFRGPHTAGTFGATLMPLFISLFLKGRDRRALAVIGVLAATAITYTSNSSGPLMGYLSCVIALTFWRMRQRMKWVRRGIVLVLFAYTLATKSPVWYIFAKLADITGGDGWHRSYLMDQCWRHKWSWWLMGTNDTSGWAVTHMVWGGADLCNMYVACAASAGMGCLVLFILLLVVSFQNLGRARSLAQDGGPAVEVVFWCLGAALFGHVIIYFSVTYWDQMDVAWWGLLAIIASVTTDLLKNPPVLETDEIIEEAAAGEAATA